MKGNETRQVWQLTDGTVVIEGKDQEGELSKRFAENGFIWRDTSESAESWSLIRRARHALYKVLDQV